MTHPPRMRFDWTVTLGNLVSAFLIVGSGTAYVVSHGVMADHAQADIAALRADMGAKFAQMSDLIAAGQEDIRTQIRELPDQRARLVEIERRDERADRESTAIEQRLRALEQAEQHVSDEIEALNHMGSSVPLARGRNAP